MSGLPLSEFERIYKLVDRAFNDHGFGRHGGSYDDMQAAEDAVLGWTMERFIDQRIGARSR